MRFTAKSLSRSLKVMVGHKDSQLIDRFILNSYVFSNLPARSTTGPTLVLLFPFHVNGDELELGCVEFREVGHELVSQNKVGLDEGEDHALPHVDVGGAEAVDEGWDDELEVGEQDVAWDSVHELLEGSHAREEHLLLTRPLQVRHDHL